MASSGLDLYFYASLGFLYTLSHPFTYPCCLFLFSIFFSLFNFVCNVHVFAHRYTCLCMWRTDVAVQFLLFSTHFLKVLLMNSDLNGLTSESQISCHHFSCTEIYMCARNPNSEHHACMQTFRHELLMMWDIFLYVH